MTQRLFPDFGSESLREARLIFMVEISGEARRLDLEKRGPGFAEAKKTLQDAATTLNNKKVNEMLAHEETLDMIASVELRRQRFQEMARATPVILQKSGEIFGRVSYQRKRQINKFIKECAKILKAPSMISETAESLQRAAGGGFSGFDTRSGILRKRRMSTHSSDSTSWLTDERHSYQGR